jgi:hypothetical protein
LGGSGGVGGTGGGSGGGTWHFRQQLQRLVLLFRQCGLQADRMLVTRQYFGQTVTHHLRSSFSMILERDDR